MSKASHAIQSLHDFIEELEMIRMAIKCEANLIESQWTQLGRIGGRRDDAAVLLLGKLVSPMTEMRDFINSCIKLIENIQKDHFKED